MPLLKHHGNPENCFEGQKVLAQRTSFTFKNHTVNVHQLEYSSDTGGQGTVSEPALKDTASGCPQPCAMLGCAPYSRRRYSAQAPSSLPTEIFNFPPFIGVGVVESVVYCLRSLAADGVNQN